MSNETIEQRVFDVARLVPDTRMLTGGPVSVRAYLRNGSVNGEIVWQCSHDHRGRATKDGWRSGAYYADCCARRELYRRRREAGV